MALIPVRSREPINGETFITEVGEAHLERWPEDYVPLEGEELARYELAKAGVPDARIDQAVGAALALAEAVEQAAVEVAADQAPTDGEISGVVVEDETPTEPAPTPAPAVDPTASND